MLMSSFLHASHRPGSIRKGKKRDIPSQHSHSIHGRFALEFFLFLNNNGVLTTKSPRLP